jgi:hypothetical protein
MRTESGIAHKNAGADGPLKQGAQFLECSPADGTNAAVN